MKPIRQSPNSSPQNEHTSNNLCIPNNIACDKQYIRYLINQLEISNKGKAHLLHYLLYASDKCRHAKLFYYAFTSSTIMLPILVTLLTACDAQQAKYVSSILVATTSIAAALLSLFKFHEKWTRYRNYIENAIAIIMDAVYGSDETFDNNGSEGPDAAAEKNKVPSDNNPSSNLERRIMTTFNKLNREHQNLWAQERRNDQTDQNKN